MIKLLKKAVILLGFTIVFTGSTAFAHTNFSTTLQQKIGNAVVLHTDKSKAYVNGKESEIDSTNSSVYPFIKDNRTLVPIRFISEGLGAKVAWNDITSTATISLNNNNVKITIGSKTIQINGINKEIDVPAQIINDRTFIPLRALVEALGKYVFWEDRGIIVISDNNNLFNTVTEKGLIDEIETVYTVPYYSMNLTGNINGNLNIHMSLDINDHEILGTYYYDKYKTNIILKGNKSISNYVELIEYDQNGNATGMFDGSLVTPNRIDGIWTNTNRTVRMPFSIKTSGEESNTNENLQWEGKWLNTYSDQFYCSEITIKDVTPTSFNLSLNANNGANTGTMDDIFKVNGNMAVFEDKDYKFIMVLTLVGDKLIVQSDGDGYFGMGVYPDGDYKQGIQPKITSLKDNGVFENDAQEESFKELVGDGYERFRDVYSAVTQEKDLDEFGAKVFDGWVQGIAPYAAGIIMYTPDGKFWAAVVDYSEIRYYTNTKDTGTLPKTIEKWKERVADLPISYMSK